MISIETMKYRAKELLGTGVPARLLARQGARRGRRRHEHRPPRPRPAGRPHLGPSHRHAGSASWANFTLTVDELGGQADAVGVVSLFAFMQADAVDVTDADGLLVLKEREGKPVHQDVDVGRPSTWGPWRRKIHGD